MINKALFLTIATQSSGLGHLMRCIAISDALKHRGVQTDFIIKSDYNIDLINTYEKYDWGNELAKIAPRLKEFSTVIVDTINITQDILDEIQNYANKLVFIDDYYRWPHNNRVIIDWTVAAEKQWIRKRTDHSEYLLGTKYAALRSEFWKKNKRYINENIENILITFGGSDNNNLTPKIIKIFRKNFNDITMNIVIGKGYKNTTEIKKLIDKKTKLIIHPGASKMREAMFNCDVAIASGGQTLYELACMGLPTIAIIMIDNQVEDTLGFQKAGFLLNAGWWNHKFFEKKFINLFNSMLSYSSRKKMSIIGQKNVDGQGAVRIAKNIVKKIR